MADQIAWLVAVRDNPSRALKSEKKRRSFGSQNIDPVSDKTLRFLVHRPDFVQRVDAVRLPLLARYKAGVAKALELKLTGEDVVRDSVHLTEQSKTAQFFRALAIPAQSALAKAFAPEVFSK